MDAIKESGKPRRLPKPKLPRKRKKAAIKAQGRKWYYDTIKLWLASKDEPWFNEPRCKFWRNDSIRTDFVQFPDGSVYPQFVPTRYW